MEQVSSPPTLKFGPFIVDLAAGEVRKNGSRIRLQEKPLRVLMLLAERQGQLVTRTELKQHLWPEDTFVDFETGLNTAVSKLRDALSDKADSPRYIETIPRRGYRFLAPVEFQARAAGPAPAAAVPTLDKDHAPPQVAPAAPAADAKSEAPKPPLPAASNAKPPARTTIWISLAAAIAIIAIIAGGAYWLTHGRPALSFHSRDSVLLADFENQTGDPRFDSALATAFTVSIEQSRYANVFPRMELDAVLKRMGRPQNERVTPTLGREICQRENVRALIALFFARRQTEGPRHPGHPPDSLEERRPRFTHTSSRQIRLRQTPVTNVGGKARRGCCTSTLWSQKKRQRKTQGPKPNVGGPPPYCELRQPKSSLLASIHPSRGSFGSATYRKTARNSFVSNAYTKTGQRG